MPSRCRKPKPTRCANRCRATLRGSSKSRPASRNAGVRACPAKAPGDALLNEAQMLLHAHPVNEAREARGELAINSLRLWGAGRAPGSAHCRWQSVTADDPAVRGAARLAGARHRPLPTSAQEWLDRLPEEGRHLALLDARQAAGRAGAALVRAAARRAARRAHRHGHAAGSRRRRGGKLRNHKRRPAPLLAAGEALEHYA